MKYLPFAAALCVAQCLLGASHAQAGGPVLQDTVAADQFSFSADDYYVSEDATNAVAIVNFVPGNRSYAGSVNFSTADGTATAGADYTPVSGTINFSWNTGPAQTVRIPITADTLRQGSETVQLFLSNPNAVISRPRATLHIVQTSGGRFSFAQATNSVVETEGNATITVVRTGGSEGIATVSYRTGQDYEGTTATPNSDFTPVSGQITFADGETNKSFALPIFDDGATNRSRAVRLLLSDSQNGATLGSTADATLLITDPLPPRLKIAADGHGALLLSWPSSCCNYVLEKSSSPFGPSWTPVTTAPVTQNGCNQITEPASSQISFYRLSRKS